MNFSVKKLMLPDNTFLHENNNFSIILGGGGEAGVPSYFHATCGQISIAVIENKYFKYLSKSR